MSEIEKPLLVIETPAQVNDIVWFIADDELYGGMSFSGIVTEVTLTQMKVEVTVPFADTWTLPLSWFKEDKAFTSELALVESCAKSWMETALEERRKNKELTDSLSQLRREKQEAEQRAADLEYELSMLSQP